MTPAPPPGLEPGDVIQLNGGHQWPGCLAVVDECYQWGVLAFIPTPANPAAGPSVGLVYIRADYGEFARIGPTAWPVLEPVDS